jgi:hypothetical protein
VEVILDKKRLANARAFNDCDLFTLNKKYYQQIIVLDYPEVDAELKEIAEIRHDLITESMALAEKNL